VYQIESRNPHLHEDKGEEHVEQMSYAAHQVVYHSSICPEEFKTELLQDMISYRFVQPQEEPVHPTYYRPLVEIDLKKFISYLQNTNYAHLFDAALVSELPFANNAESLANSSSE